MATINMHMKFEIEIPKETWLMLRKPCRRQTDGQTDGRTDKVNPVYPPSNFVGRGYNYKVASLTLKHCNRNVEYPSLVTPKVVKITTLGVANDENVIKMMTFPF